MSQESIVYLIAGVFFATGIFLIVMSRPIARGYAWVEAIVFGRFPPLHEVGLALR